MAEGIVIREAHFPGRAPIDAYGNGGFRFADMSHRGSLLCLPSGIYGWEPNDPLALTLDDFARVLRRGRRRSRSCWSAPARNCGRSPSRCAQALRAAGISADPMATGAAVRTYNVLLAEDRAVAAALIAVD